MALTVLAIADEIDDALYDHFAPENWSNVDLVVSCGDLSPEYLDFLGTMLSVPVFYVRGNHDGSYQASRYDGFHNLHGRVTSYRGLRLAGFEGCQRYNHGRYQYTEREMERVVSHTRRSVRRLGRPNIVVTHAPPAGIHDGEDLCHRGFVTFNSIIDDWHPAYFVHGHTHAYYGQPKLSMVGESAVVNAFRHRVFTVATAPEESTAKTRRWWPSVGFTAQRLTDHRS